MSSCVFCQAPAHGIYAGIPKCLEHSRNDIIPILEDTRTWMTLKQILLQGIETRHYGSMIEYEPSDEFLRAFLLINWTTHAPRQTEVAILEQQVKIMSREVEQRGAEIKRLNTLIAEWKKTHQ